MRVNRKLAIIYLETGPAYRRLLDGGVDPNQKDDASYNHSARLLQPRQPCVIGNPGSAGRHPPAPRRRERPPRDRPGPRRRRGRARRQGRRVCVCVGLPPSTIAYNYTDSS